MAKPDHSIGPFLYEPCYSIQTNILHYLLQFLLSWKIQVFMKVINICIDIEYHFSMKMLHLKSTAWIHFLCVPACGLKFLQSVIQNPSIVQVPMVLQSIPQWLAAWGRLVGLINCLKFNLMWWSWRKESHNKYVNLRQFTSYVILVRINSCVLNKLLTTFHLSKHLLLPLFFFEDILNPCTCTPFTTYKFDVLFYLSLHFTITGPQRTQIWLDSFAKATTTIVSIPVLCQYYKPQLSLLI